MGLYNLAWAVVLLPLLGALTTFMAETARRAVQVCTLFSALAFALSAVVLGEWLAHAYASPFQNVISFFGVNPPEGGVFAARFEPFFGVHVDAMSAAFAFVITFVTLAVQAYALTSLRGDTGYRRFGWTSSLLAFAALGTVFSPNLFQSLFMWMAASVALYLMTLHWWQRDDAGGPARRIATVLRSSDLALLLATVWLFVKFGIYASSIPTPPGQDITDPFAFNTINAEVTGLVQHHVNGAGLRTLAILSALIVFAVVVRAAQAGFHAWLADAATTPVPVMAATVSLGMLPAVYLLARLYPIVINTPHALTALGLTAAVTALVVSLVCLAQRDVLRIALLSGAVQVALALVTLSGGDYGQGLFVAFTATLFGVLGIVAAGNLVRLYRTRNLMELGGAWQRMRATSFAAAVWAFGAGGLALQTYYALAAVFADRSVAGVPFGATTRIVLAVLVALAALALTVAVMRVMVRALLGAATVRRGFRPERVTEVEASLRLWTTVITLAAVLAVIVGFPAVHGVGSGHSRLPALTFIHFISFRRPVDTGLDGAALLIALALLAAGTASAWLAFSPGRRERTASLVGRLRPAVRLLGQHLYLERARGWVEVPFSVAARLSERFDEGVLDALPDSLGQGAAVSAWSLARLRGPRLSRHLAGGLAAVFVLVLLSILAATGHLGGVHTL